MKMESTHMSHGTGENSYARTSLIQANSISKVFPVVKEALEGLYATMSPKCVMVAELGCASGPNTLMLLPEIIDITYNTYRAKKYTDVPEINMFLNDLPTNDFNTICGSLAIFHEELKKERDGDIGSYFISITPGSYYKRLFPSNFLHFVHSSNSAHWLSQVPKKLINERGEYVNKGNVYITETSPPEVLKAYQTQFKEDFTSFLKCRAQEIVHGGRMVINMMATTQTCKPQDCFLLKLINIVLRNMASKGLIDEKKLDDFEIPFYPPKEEEVKHIIESEKSFSIYHIKKFTVNWDVPIKELQVNETSNGYIEIHNLALRAKVASGPIKSTTESMIASHFGDHIINEYFSRVTKLVTKQLRRGEKLETFHQAITLIKK